MVKFLIPLVGLGFSSLCLAENPIRVQVLNTNNGQPAAHLHVTLEAQQNNQWVQIGEGDTNDQGQLDTLYPKDKANLDKGYYRATFKTGDWFRSKNQRSFYAEVPVVFVIDGSMDHYNIPLQISPYGYSTYRGS
ncbi:hydroxyisourate hydrolase [Acinetobacter sp. MB5]|uniref:hydroxyisourate hydrolase n=1 Tax=Acinetobacter sp. MB5 TaxID=2069438 RepID=UPI000DCFB23E|nr:hydroxyisourate hydrolase [Acinetobacter sp. MB5]